MRLGFLSLIDKTVILEVILETWCVYTIVRGTWKQQRPDVSHTLLPIQLTKNNKPEQHSNSQLGCSEPDNVGQKDNLRTSHNKVRCRSDNARCNVQLPQSNGAGPLAKRVVPTNAASRIVYSSYQELRSSKIRSDLACFTVAFFASLQ